MNGFSVQRACELLPLPQQQHWLIQQLWSHEAVGIIGGEPKSCKSFLALGMAVAVASGHRCLGRFAVPAAGPVLLFAAEDALHIVRQRLDGICAYHGIELRNLDLWVITVPIIRLDHDTDITLLDKTLQHVAPTLLVLDPLVRLHRVDENQSAAIAPLLASLRQLQRKHHCAVALVHHTRKGASAVRAGQALRGSSELHAWGDSNLYVRRQKGRLWLSVEHRAQPSTEPFGLRLNTDNHAIALVAQDADTNDDNQPHDACITQTLSAQQRVIQALNRFHGPVRLRPLRNACRIRSQSLSVVLNELVESGQVIRSEHGWTLTHRQTDGNTPDHNANFEQLHIPQ